LQVAFSLLCLPYQSLIEKSIELVFNSFFQSAAGTADSSRLQSNLQAVRGRACIWDQDKGCIV
jgi:hypothetical protein